MHLKSVVFNPDCAVGSVARSRKQKRNVQSERFCDVGICINMSRSNLPEAGKNRETSVAARIFKPQQETTAQSGFNGQLEQEGMSNSAPAYYCRMPQKEKKKK